MATGPDDVRLNGKSGSSQPTAKVTAIDSERTSVRRLLLLTH